jgi:hypothetical protein
MTSVMLDVDKIILHELLPQNHRKAVFSITGLVKAMCRKENIIVNAECHMKKNEFLTFLVCYI